ncbi:MAG: 2-dehydro-3-deoxy-D-gluconate 5-dehydrogenase KduD [Spirochaetales bacterium]|nr:2-dehydro-3-deoxy-D-gluconate 5-dehydrogenase KduD [Spirochaetales bacterium]
MILEQFSLEGKKAIVTGCSTGLGQGIAIGLAEAGADVFGVGMSEPTETARQIKEAGREFYSHKCNLMKQDGLDDLIAAAKEKMGRIDILVNNAGIIRREDAIDFGEQDWDDVLNINLKSLFMLSQKAARVFIDQGNGGKIINIASMLSYQGGIRVPAYTASKSAVLGLTRALANEWAQHNITCNGIAPGYMVTNNTEALRNDPERNAAILGRIPAGRWGSPRDIAGAAVFLASPASDYVNGFTLAVDGGWLAR